MGLQHASRALPSASIPAQLVDEARGRTSTTAPSGRSSSSTARRRPRCSSARARTWARSTAPALVLWPGGDPYIGPEFGAAYAEALGNAELRRARGRRALAVARPARSWSTTWRRSSLARLEPVPAKRLLAILMAAFALAGCNGNDESEDAERTSAPPAPAETQTADRGGAGRRAARPPRRWPPASRPRGRSPSCPTAARWSPSGPGRVRLLSKDLKLRRRARGRGGRGGDRRERAAGPGGRPRVREATASSTSTAPPARATRCCATASRAAA